MVASLRSGADLRSVVQIRLVPDDEPAVRRLDDAAAEFLSDHSGSSCFRSASTEPSAGPVPLPAGFESMEPGPELGAVLAEIPVRRVSGHDTVDVMAAAYRQVCHAQAVFLRALLETGMRRPHTPDSVSRLESPGEFAAEEARAALMWSRRRADSTFEFAWQVHERLPMLGEALQAGELDEPRARAFIQWTIGLSDDQAAQIVTVLLPQAAGLLVGALIDRIKQLAIALDPDWAERRYQAAVKGRRVEGSRNDDGTANVHGLDLPVRRAAAACDRIDTLARACKRAGDGRPIDHVRADLYLGMLDGTFEVFTEDQIVDHVLHHPFTDIPDPDDTVRGHGDSDDGAQPAGDDRPGSGGGCRGNGGPGHGFGGGADKTDFPGDRAGSCSGRSPGDGSRPPAAAPSGHRPADAVTASTTDQPATPGPAVAGGSPGGWCVRELRVEVAAMLELNEHPAEIVGWDFITAALARQLMPSMTGAEWRWVVCDRDGRPTDCGITRRRPAPPSSAGPPAPGRSAGRGRSAIVELQLKADELPQLIAAGRRLGWDAVLADIACQHTAADAPISPADARDAASGATDPAVDRQRRSARAGLRRAVQIRDRCCTHPACRAPASRTDQDHAVDHVDGGATDEANLGCGCRHDHRLKHDGGWRIIRSASDTTIWTSPLGHTYASRPPPVMSAAPEPWPAADPIDTAATTPRQQPSHVGLMDAPPF